MVFQDMFTKMSENCLLLITGVHLLLMLKMMSQITMPMKMKRMLDFFLHVCFVLKSCHYQLFYVLSVGRDKTEERKSFKQKKSRR